VTFWYALPLAGLLWATATPGHSAETCAGRTLTFEFVDRDDTVSQPFPSLSQLQQDKFKQAFCDEITNLDGWAKRSGWSPPLHFPGLRIHVSGVYDLARTLVPLWRGDAGRMEFPADRAAVGEATLLHELVHLYFPNSNRMLAEGFATYLQAAIGKNPAYPNFGRPLHQRMRCIFPDLSLINLEHLDQSTTPTHLMLRVGREMVSDGRAYIIAGSFVQYLIEDHGTDKADLMQKFHTVYHQTPLIPLQRDAGAPQRWAAVYGIDLSGLAQKWKAVVAATPC
jgi:hypothetical protein